MEHNKSVDCLAKLAFAEKENLQVFETLQREALEFLETDRERSICIP